MGQKGIQAAFNGVLYQINREGGFDAAVLATNDGLSIAAAGSYNADMLAAIVPQVKKFVLRARAGLDMAMVDEVSVVHTDRTRLVSRYFDVDGEELILTVIVPRRRSYRRATNQAIREIKRILLNSEIGS